MARVLYYADVENAYDDPERVGRLAAVLRRLRDAGTLVCGGGDNTGPGALALKAEGFAAMPFFEAVKPDADTLGNHEFDRQPAAVRELVAASPQTWVCANAYDGDERFAAEEGLVPWTVFERGGERVGVFGVASPETGDISPAAADLRFTDPVVAAREAVAALRERGVDHVVGLSHCGDDDPLAEALDVPVVLGGHTHEPREAVVDGTLLLRPGPIGKRVAEVRVDDDGADVTWHPTTEVDPDPDVTTAYRARRRDLGLDEVVARVDQPVARLASRGESAVGNFVADALRAATGADIGLMHGGSIREADPFEGAVTVGDLVSLVPFDNRVVTVEVTGRQLRTAIREAPAPDRDYETPRWYFQLSNARVVWDHRAADLRAVEVGGDPVDPDGHYTVATPDYLTRDGGLFDRLDATVRVAAGDIHEVLAAHAREAGIPTEVEGRVERLHLPGDD